MVIDNQKNKLAEEHFVAWLITQTNSHGSFYLERVSRQYARYLRTQPLKLMIPMSIEENGEFEMNEQEIAAASVETLREPLQIRSVELQRVGFLNLQVCKRTNPYSCKIGFIDVPIRGTWIDLFVDVVELFVKTKQEQIEMYKFKGGRPLLMDEPLPNLNCKTLANGKVILVNYGIETIVQLIWKICSACDIDLNDVNITYIPKSGTGGGNDSEVF